MSKDIEQKSIRKQVKEAFRVEVGEISPSTFLLALRAVRVVRKRLGMQGREFELLMAIDVLSERNEKRIGHYATCKAEIDTLMKDIVQEEALRYSVAALRSAGYILTDSENTRWSYEAPNYKLTVSGRQIIKQYKQQLEALQIELNTAKICK